jgi:hypothetical protein
MCRESAPWVFRRHASRNGAVELSASAIVDALSRAAIKHFAKTKLYELNLTAANVSDAGIEQLSQLTAVRQLRLHSTLISQQGHETLKASLPKTTIEWHPDRLAALHFLSRGAGIWLEGQRNWMLVRSPEELPRHSFGLAKIAVAGNKAVGDDDVRYLRGVNRLVQIDLSGTAIGDSSLDVLAGIQILEQLVLKDVKVSSTAIERFQAALPRCEIIR